MSEEIYPPGVQEIIRRGALQTEAESALRNQRRQMKFDTIAVHGLYDMEAALANQGSIIEPAYLSSAQHFENSDAMEAGLANLAPAWAYSRIGNPTLNYLEETLAMLEGYRFEGEVNACVSASGMAAIFLATDPFLSIQPGTIARMNIVASARCYGGTFTLFSRYADERGVEVRWVQNPNDSEEWKSKLDENTRFAYGEMPSNPSLTIFDIAEIAKVVHDYGIPFIIDSTVATPALLRPLCHGADIIIHSVTKSMCASGLAMAGAVIARRHIPSRVGSAEMRENFALYVKQSPNRYYGPVLSSLNALLILTDLRTLRSKTDLISQNALCIAQFLRQHPHIEEINYPGLPDNPDFQLASRYLWLVDSEDDYGKKVNRFGYLLSFRVKGGKQASRRVLDRLKLIWHATDLGRVKSIACIPAISTHQQQGESGRALAGLPADLIRLSVGAENATDLINDLSQALETIR